VSSKNDNALSLKVIFYSQTGTAEDFANRLSDEAKQFGFEVETVDAENYKKVNLSDVFSGVSMFGPLRVARSARTSKSFVLF
jgi:sulfite reductase alpha subunit-like flavoprotein